MEKKHTDARVRRVKKKRRETNAHLRQQVLVGVVGEVVDNEVSVGIAHCAVFSWIAQTTRREGEEGEGIVMNTEAHSNKRKNVWKETKAKPTQKEKRNKNNRREISSCCCRWCLERTAVGREVG